MSNPPSYFLKKQAIILWLAFFACLALAAAGCKPLSQPDDEAAKPGVVESPQGGGALVPTAGIVLPQAGVQEMLPPALVEINPPPGSELALKGEMVFYFNQPMQHSTVESAITFQPAAPGRFVWQDEHTVKFTPAKFLPAGKELQVQIASSARAANGKTMQDGVALRFQTGQYLRLAEHLPKPDSADVDPSAALVVTFTQPVTPLTADQKDFPPAFKLDPPASGRGEWVNTSTYLFYPDPPLLGGTTYTVSINQQVTSTLGAGFETGAGEKTGWSFTTSTPKLLTVEPDSANPLALDAAIKLTFNQPMDQQSVQDNFALRGEGDVDIPGKFTWNDDGVLLTFKADKLLPRGEQLNLVVSGQAHARGGTPLGSDINLTYLATLPMAVEQTTPALNQPLDASGGYNSVLVKFTAPLASQDLSVVASIEPEVGDLRVYGGDADTMVFSGVFNPSTDYTLKISSTIKDMWGQSLGKPFIMDFRTSEASSALVIPMLQVGSSALYIPPGYTNIPAQVTNLANVQVSSASLTADMFATLEQNFDLRNAYKPERKNSWQQTFSLTQNRTETIKLALSSDQKSLPTGLYFYQVRNPVLEGKGKFPPPPILLVISRVHLVLKHSLNQMYLWAVNMDDNTPLANLPLTLERAADRQNAGNCTTDQQGVCEIKLSPTDSQASFFALSGQPGDDLFSMASEDWSAGVGGWNFGLANYIGKAQPLVYLYTDRPIYRPGQTVNFRAIVRQPDNGRYSISSLKQISVKITGVSSSLGAQEPPQKTLTVPLDAYGAGYGTYQLLNDAAPGNYMMSVNENDSTYAAFQVAEYRKPLFDLSVNTSNPDLLSGQNFKATIQANYFFGAPLAGKEVSWTLSAARAPVFLEQGFEAGKLVDSGFEGMPGSSGLGFYLSEGKGVTDDQGQLKLDVALVFPDSVDAEDLQKLNLEVSVLDESKNPVSGHASALMHPAAFAIGARPEGWGGQAGKEIGIDVQTVDWNSGTSPNHALKAGFQKITWKQTSIQNSVNYNPQANPDYTEVSSVDFKTDANGQARLAFTPSQPGSYRLQINGDGALTEILVWVGGRGSISWPSLPNQQISLQADKVKYQSGQQASIIIPNPFEKGALALVTVERAKVMRSQVIKILDANYELALPLWEEDAPNVYISVLLLGRQADGKPDFRQGFINLMVDPTPETLTVTMTPKNLQSAPGATELFNIQVNDNLGKPVQGEFSLALVDKAIYALADPNASKILDALYGVQPLGVTSALSMAAYAGRIPYAAPGKGGGGGNAVTVVREKFKDTAYWNATIVTDANGAAVVSVTLPDNLTTWVATLRGITIDSRVGETETMVVVTKDLLVQPVTPRFFVAGDHVSLAALVHNNTTQPLSGEVSLQVNGATLDDPNQAVQKVQLSSGEQRRVEWWVHVQDVDKIDLVFGAHAGGLIDLTRPDQGSLPVLHYSVPETFSTSGVLNGSGERLELISLPRSFTPSGGELNLEMTPTLAGTILSGLRAQDSINQDISEAQVSVLLPNIETYRGLKDLKIENPALKQQLEKNIQNALGHLLRTQNVDGGWGWTAGEKSSNLISPYVLLGLSQASQAGFFVDQEIIHNGQAFLAANLQTPDVNTENWQLDRQALIYYALQESGAGNPQASQLYTARDRMNPWAKALLLLILKAQNKDNPQVADLQTNLEGQAQRLASGAYWKETYPGQWNLSTPNFNTAVVNYALAITDPSSVLVDDGARYLAAQRQACNCWGSSYENAWVLTSLIETLKSSGDMLASFSFSASLNGIPLVDGKAAGSALTSPLDTIVPLSRLLAEGPNALRIQHGPGTGKLYYRAALQVHRPADSASPLQHGLTLVRRYLLAGEDCKGKTCQSINTVPAGGIKQLVEVHLSLIVPDDMYYMDVEDTIPAGAEILNLQLKNSPQGENQPAVAAEYNPRDPMQAGWGWWYFGSPQIFDDHIRWSAEFLPAGTYELVYDLLPLQAGEYRLIPARANPYYFPEVEGTSGGGILTITP